MADKPHTSLDVAEFFLRRILIVGVIVLAVLLGGAWALQKYGPRPTPPTVPPQPTSRGDVGFQIALPGTLEIDFGNGSKIVYTFYGPLDPSATVLSVLRSPPVGTPAPVTIAVDVSGNGEFAFVNAIAGAKNQGAGPTARNWQFSINGKPATAGAGVTPVTPRDHIVWEFKPFIPPPNSADQPPTPLS